MTALYSYLSSSFIRPHDDKRTAELVSVKELMFNTSHHSTTNTRSGDTRFPVNLVASTEKAGLVTKRRTGDVRLQAGWSNDGTSASGAASTLYRLVAQLAAAAAAAINAHCCSVTTTS